MDALRKRRLILVLAGAALLAAVAIVFLVPRHAPPSPLAGMVRQTEIRIAPEISGRLTSVAVRAGQAVRKGELLAQLDNPELDASLGEAKAAAASAKAERARIYAGVRDEERAILARSVETAEANLLLAEQENARAVALAARDFASKPEARREQCLAGQGPGPTSTSSAPSSPPRNAGPTAEERALADARVGLAEATVADLQAKLDKTRLVAPVDGVVGVLVAELGEVVPVGKPVLTLEVGTDRGSPSRCARTIWGSLAVGMRPSRWRPTMAGSIRGARHGAPAARRVRDLARRARRRRP